MADGKSEGVDPALRILSPFSIDGRPIFRSTWVIPKAEVVSFLDALPKILKICSGAEEVHSGLFGFHLNRARRVCHVPRFASAGDPSLFAVFRRRISPDTVQPISHVSLLGTCHSG